MGGLFFIFIGIGLTAWETMARLARGQVLSVREKEYVEAARAMGAGDRRIMFRHILPNIIGPLIVAETLAIPSLHRYRSLPVLHRPGRQSADAFVGLDDLGRLAGDSHVSQSGHFPGAGADDYDVRVQLPG